MLKARKLILTNEEDRPRRIMVISQAAVAMAARDEFEASPGTFSRLFIETECLPGERTLLFRRRPRSSTEKTPLPGPTHWSWPRIAKA